MLRSAILSSSGVSFGQSDGSVSAGLLSAPEASDSARSSKGLRGVVKAGFRKGAAVWLPGIRGVKKEEDAGGACCFVGVESGGGFEKGFCDCDFVGEEKTA